MNNRYDHIIKALTDDIELLEKEVAYAFDYQSKSTYNRKLRMLKETFAARERFINKEN